jgi:hypothetical protein
VYRIIQIKTIINKKKLVNDENRLNCITSFLKSVWRIRDVYPGSQIRLFSIPDPGSELSPFQIPDPGSSSKNLSILTPKKAKKMVSKL